MCGIFAYRGKKQNGAEIVLSGLKSLEYRGYDSWGIAMVKHNDEVYIETHVGKIGDAVLPKFDSSIGIGHTRWATHGKVTEENSHPHTSCDRNIVIVHNGIVENFNELKSSLQKKGHRFTSETDSEVIAHLVEEEIRSGVSENKTAVLNSFNKLKGLNATIIFFPKSKEFFAIKNGSPIVFAHTNGESFIASDGSSILPYTNKLFFLEDNEILHIADSYELNDFNLQSKPIVFTEVPLDKSSVSLGNFKHFMMKEIYEQPKVLTNIIKTQKGNIEHLSKVIQQSYGSYFIGCGTAYYACLAGSYLFSKIAKRHINAEVASEFQYLTEFLKKDSLVIALSQSGETIDIVSSVREAKKKGSKLISITNVLGSTLYRISDEKILLHAGPEKCVLATKSFTAKVAILYLLANQIAGTYEQGVEDLKRAVTEVEALLTRKEKIREIAAHLEKSAHIFILGRGVSYPTALESSLKIKEVSYIHAEGFAAGELKHGVIALVEKGTPVIVYNPSDETHEDTLSAAYEVKARGAYIIGISDKNNEVFDEFIEVRNCNDATIIPNVVVAQLLGYYISLIKGYDPDKPRNLAKSVTVK